MKTKRLEGCSIYIHLGCISAILKASKVDTNGPIPNNISVKVGSPTNLDDSPAHPSIKHWQLMRKRTMHSHPSASYISIIVKQLARRYWCKKNAEKRMVEMSRQWQEGWHGGRLLEKTNNCHYTIWQVHTRKGLHWFKNEKYCTEPKKGLLHIVVAMW